MNEKKKKLIKTLKSFDDIKTMISNPKKYVNYIVNAYNTLEFVKNDGGISKDLINKIIGDNIEIGLINLKKFMTFTINSEIEKLEKINIEKVFSNAINNGITKNQITYNIFGITIWQQAFWLEKWTDQTLPKYIKDLFPYIIGVGESAFSNSTFTKIDMPLVTYIGDFAFNNSPVTEINIPMSRYIGLAAFYKSNLKTLYLKNIEIISRGAFYKSKLTDWKFNKNVKICKNAFNFTPAIKHNS